MSIRDMQGVGIGSLISNVAAYTADANFTGAYFSDVAIWCFHNQKTVFVYIISGCEIVAVWR
jgi:hypothetical protein